MAGYSKRSLAEKLGIKEGLSLFIFNPPGHYFKMIGTSPPNVIVEKKLHLGFPSCYASLIAHLASVLTPPLGFLEGPLDKHPRQIQGQFKLPTKSFGQEPGIL